MADAGLFIKSPRSGCVGPLPTARGTNLPRFRRFSKNFFRGARACCPLWDPAANLGVVGLDRIPGGSAAPTDDRERMTAKSPLIWHRARRANPPLPRRIHPLSRCDLAL